MNGPLAHPAAAGRFAPSPTGPLHLGNLRTALLAWLFARSRAGRFSVRVEDLDHGRCRAEHITGHLDDLRRLGLDWDGEPMRQSRRVGQHREALQELLDQGLLYRCWCTRAEIRSAASAPQEEGLEGAYPGTCRRLSAAARAERARRRPPPAWRVDADARRVAFVDRLHGPVESPVDDFVVWREGAGASARGTPAYNLAVVVDDDAQGVGEVVRGDDLLSTTPRQVLLARLLGIRVRSYAHVPLVLGPDGSRLAKRHGAVSLAERMADGQTGAEIVGWMAWTAGLIERPAPCAPGELLTAFDPQRIRRTPTVWTAGTTGRDTELRA